jgi:tetratricopeptide (TPR) repeat protein
MADDDIERQFRLMRTAPDQFLEEMNRLVAQRPDDARAYFARHQAWSRLGRSDLALADLDKSQALEDRFTVHDARGDLLRRLGRYYDAIDAYNRAEQMAPMEWRSGFGPFFRADCHARLGDEAGALADCDALPDDHWTPGMFGAPAGTKEEVAAELHRRAAAARGEREVGSLT